MALWLVRAGKSGEYESKFLKDNKIYLTWDKLNKDLSKIDNRDELYDILNSIYQGSKNSIINWGGQIWAFVRKMKIDDWVLLPSKFSSTINIGRIKSDYISSIESENPYYHYREVEWIAKDIPRSNFDQDILYSAGAFLTICQIWRNDAEKRIKDMYLKEWKVDSWEKDKLNRQQYANFLTNILISKPGPYVLNINADWGLGKTFFLIEWKKDLEKDEKKVIYFNAWEKDYTDDPLMSLILCIKEQLKPFLESFEHEEKLTQFVKSSGVFLKKIAPVLAKGLARKFIGIDGKDVDTFFDTDTDGKKSLVDLTGEATKALFKVEEKKEKEIDELKSHLSELIDIVLGKDVDNDKNENLYIFIDELDRCKPLYSVNLLEKVKHLFDVPNLIFVIATDTKQLQYSVKAIYGEGFNGYEYLRRFFNTEFTLPEPSYKDFINYLFYKEGFSENSLKIQHDQYNTFTLNDNNKNQIIRFFCITVELFKLNLRSQEQCVQRFISIEQTENTNNQLFTILLIVFYCKHPEFFHKLGTTNYNEVFNQDLKEYWGAKILINYPDINGKNNKQEMDIYNFFKTLVEIANTKSNDTELKKFLLFNKDHEFYKNHFNLVSMVGYLNKDYLFKLPLTF